MLCSSYDGIPDTQVCSVCLRSSRIAVERYTGSQCQVSLCFLQVCANPNKPSCHSIRSRTDSTFAKSAQEPLLCCGRRLQHLPVIVQTQANQSGNMGAIELIGEIVYTSSHATPLLKARLNGYSDRAPNICMKNHSICILCFVFLMI